MHKNFLSLDSYVCYETKFYDFQPEVSGKTEVFYMYAVTRFLVHQVLVSSRWMTNDGFELEPHQSFV